MPIPTIPKLTISSQILKIPQQITHQMCDAGIRECGILNVCGPLNTARVVEDRWCLGVPVKAVGPDFGRRRGNQALR